MSEMRPERDGRPKPIRLIAFSLAFSAVGVIFGDEVFDWIYRLLGVELPPWR